MITHHDLMRWKKETLYTAKGLGFDPNILDEIDRTVILKIDEGFPRQGMWYGFCFYFTPPEIVVYSQNLSTEEWPTIKFALIRKGLPSSLIREVKEVFDKVGAERFREIYNQSGMDHELIGHLYNYLTGKRHDERAAVETQVIFGKERSGLIMGRDWIQVMRIMQRVLAYHKGIDELK